MIDTFIDDQEHKMKLFRAMETIPCVEKKAKWALQWINNENASLARRLFAFGIVEGLFFSGSFCAIFWLKEKGKLINSLGKSNEWIARDESLHTDFAILISKIYSEREGKPKQDTIHEIYKEAVVIEKEFITKSIPCNMIGMNIELMCQYIEYVADRLLGKLNLPPIYNSENPFEFMIYISLQGKSNFFESRPTEYQNAHVLNQNKAFTLEEDF